MKRILTIADTHCGHKVGLTPPAWQNREDQNDPHDAKLLRLRRACWDFYENTIRREGPFDAVLFNGDAIDGKGERSGGTELITSDRNKQVEIAVACIKAALGAKTKLVMTYGTPYHTGQGEDYERNIADKLGCKIGSHEWVRVEGVTFDLKHKVGSSQVPHGRHTAAARDRLWNTLWAERGEQPRAQVIIRSHVHYHGWAGDHRGVAMTLPALQAAGTKYGARQCSGIVDFGLVTWTINERSWAWQSHIMECREARAAAITLS
jgi:hypothetical protein